MFFSHARAVSPQTADVGRSNILVQTIDCIKYGRSFRVWKVETYTFYFNLIKIFRCFSYKMFWLWINPKLAYCVLISVKEVWLWFVAANTAAELIAWWRWYLCVIGDQQSCSWPLVWTLVHKKDWVLFCQPKTNGSLLTFGTVIPELWWHTSVSESLHLFVYLPLRSN